MPSGSQELCMSLIRRDFVQVSVKKDENETGRIRL